MDSKELIKLKDKHWNIYQSNILEYSFIWREISRGEFNKILRYYINDYDREEQICNLCLIKPEEFDFEKCEAGVATALSIQILRESGYSSEPTGKLSRMLGQYREDMNLFQNQVSCIIHEAFPSLDIEEIENWNFEKTLWYFSRAEYKLSLRGIAIEDVSGGNNPKEKAMLSPVQGLGISGAVGDFPEAKMQKAFMEGKMRF